MNVSTVEIAALISPGTSVTCATLRTQTRIAVIAPANPPTSTFLAGIALCILAIRFPLQPGSELYWLDVTGEVERQGAGALLILNADTTTTEAAAPFAGFRKSLP